MEKDLYLEECLEYFTSTPVLNRILQSCMSKYKSFGTVCGNVVLNNLKQEEIEELEGFTGKNYHGKKKASISVNIIQKAIDTSRFSGIKIEDILTLYSKGELKSKKQEIFEENIAIEEFFNKLISIEFKLTRSGEWISRIKEQNDKIYQLLKNKYRKKVIKEKNVSLDEEKIFYKEISIFLDTLNRLPYFFERYEYMPAFASAVSGDPHYYDEGKEYTGILYQSINSMLCLGKNVSAGMNAEEKHQLLFEAGLIRDNMSNDVLVYGIKAWAKEGEHMGISGFFDQQEPLSLTLSTIIRLQSAECIERCIYVVENPTVFAKLTESGYKSVLCVNGQPNLAVLLLLDIITKNENVIYYNGDFDPEGLLIAQRLKNRYKEKMFLWHYKEEDYILSCSEKTISEKRLKMLEHIKEPELKEMSDRLLKIKKAGYQEKIFG